MNRKGDNSMPYLEATLALLVFLSTTPVVVSSSQVSSPPQVLSSPSQEDRTMHPISLRKLVLSAPGSAKVKTHICVEGEATYIRRQGDGDLHIRLCGLGSDSDLCIVAECVPYLPCGGNATELDLLRPRPRKGQHVKICGISRYDGYHGWWEIHPVERIETLEAK